MPLKAHIHRISLNAVLLLAILACLCFNTSRVAALGNGGAALLDFGEFSKTLQNGQAGLVRGVYVPEVLALPIVQQPAGNVGYVSSQDGEITQFGMAAQFAAVGLLAHNHLSGRLFSQLAVGQEVRLVYGDGKVEYFIITQLLQFQALEPTNPYGSFRDLRSDDILTADQLFSLVYRGDRHVTFQTCIANGENFSWGRLFILAIPKSQVATTNRFDPTQDR